METLIENLKANVDSLEDVALAADTNLATLPQWDSLAMLSTMAMVASEYGVNITSQEIAACKSLADLDALIRSKS